MSKLTAAAILAAFLFPVPRLCATTVVDFEDLSLDPGTYENGAGLAGGFASHGVHFGNSFDDSFGFDLWSGFAYSRVEDPTTPGYGNQYASAGGSGQGGGGIYAVAHHNLTGEQADIVSFPAPTSVHGLFVNNTTYTALSMRDGDAFAKQFGGASGTDPDWFRLTIRGENAAGQSTGEVVFYLADFRFQDPAEDYIVTDWTWVDTSGLGSSVSSLHFDLASSDNGDYGMNTPSYFALDDLVIPEPGTLGLIVLGIAALSKRRTVPPSRIGSQSIPCPGGAQATPSPLRGEGRGEG